MENPISELHLWGVTCYMGSPHNVNWHPTQVNFLWIHPAISPASKAGTRFTYPGRMEGWVVLCDLIAPQPEVEPATSWSKVWHTKRMCGPFISRPFENWFSFKDYVVYIKAISLFDTHPRNLLFLQTKWNTGRLGASCELHWGLVTNFLTKVLPLKVSQKSDDGKTEILKTRTAQRSFGILLRILVTTGRLTSISLFNRLIHEVPL